jgi:SHS2 domain-containing protein
MSYAFFDHTGDVGVALAAVDTGRLFGDAARALTDTLVDLAGVAPTDETTVELEAADLDLLLVDWMSELLYRFEASGWLTRTASCSVVEGENVCRLTAVARGERFDPARHEARVLVKAVTYHGLEVRPGPPGVTARVVLDI